MHLRRKARGVGPKLRAGLLLGMGACSSDPLTITATCEQAGKLGFVEVKTDPRAGVHVSGAKDPRANIRLTWGDGGNGTTPGTLVGVDPGETLTFEAVRFKKRFWEKERRASVQCVVSPLAPARATEILNKHAVAYLTERSSGAGSKPEIDVRGDIVRGDPVYKKKSASSMWEVFPLTVVGPLGSTLKVGGTSEVLQEKPKQTEPTNYTGSALPGLVSATEGLSRPIRGAAFLAYGDIKESSVSLPVELSFGGATRKSNIEVAFVGADPKLSLKIWQNQALAEVQHGAIFPLKAVTRPMKDATIFVSSGTTQKFYGQARPVRETDYVVLGKDLPEKPVGTCSYIGVEAKRTLVPREFSTYDTRTGKVVDTKVVEPGDDGCPRTTWTTRSNPTVSHYVKESAVDAFVAGLRSRVKP